MDNARIHKTQNVIQLIKKSIVWFSFPPYSPELNKVENTFGRLKNKISFKNLNSKDLRHVIIEEKNISVKFKLFHEEIIQIIYHF